MVAQQTRYPKLTRSIIRALGGGEDAQASLCDITEHGADAGFPGFTYYRDTVAFFKRHRADIVDMVEAMSEELGETPAEMVAGFNCLGGNRQSRNRDEFMPVPQRTALERQEDRELLASVSRCLYGGRLTDDDDVVANALAWFALEEVAREIVDNC